MWQFLPNYRHKLHECLSDSEESLLYCGSVIFIPNVDEPPKVRTADYVGNLTDELEYVLLFKYLCRVNQELCVFSFLTNRNTYDQTQGEGHNLDLRKIKGCKLQHIVGYNSERHRTGACT